MHAYYIALRHAMKDEDEMRIYREKTPATLEGREFKVRAQYGRVRVTSGEHPGVVAIMEFPSFEAAEDWYESAGYQDAVHHLYAAADMQCFILEGGAEDTGEDSPPAGRG